MEALHDVVKSGKALYVGASSMYAWQFAKMLHIAESHGWTPFVSMQNHYNLIYREEEREMIPLCLDQGIAVIPWSPLTRGFLAGNRTRQKSGGTDRARTDDLAHRFYYSDSDFEVVDRLVELALRRGVAPAQIALAWILHKPGVTAPIVGASKMEHLDQALGALDIALDETEITFLRGTVPAARRAGTHVIIPRGSRGRRPRLTPAGRGSSPRAAARALRCPG